MNKQHLRTKMLEIRMNIPSSTLDQISEQAVQEILNHPIYKHAKHIGIYHPIKNEINILGLLKDASKTFYLPKVYGQTMHYLLYDDALKQSELGIYEPTTNQTFDETLDLIIVPALVVDNTNHRIGYGKGFFDKFMNHYKHIQTLGIVMSFQVVEKFTHSLHDQKLHDIIIIPFED